jgi:hydrogenase nickel incorporation protein HypA/HybF
MGGRAGRVHELSLCRAIAGVEARAAGGRPVRRVGVRVGALRQVVPDTLVYCWDLLTKDTGLSGGVLDVEAVPAQVSCAACGRTHTLRRLVLRCEACNSTEVTVIAGEELLVTTLDLGRDRRGSVPPSRRRPCRHVRI